METSEKPSTALKILDLFFIRPILCVPLASASTAIHIGLSPLTYLSGIGEQSARVLVEAPWRYTNKRLWGDFGHYKDGYPITVIEKF